MPCHCTAPNHAVRSSPNLCSPLLPFRHAFTRRSCPNLSRPDQARPTRRLLPFRVIRSAPGLALSGLAAAAQITSLHFCRSKHPVTDQASPSPARPRAYCHSKSPPRFNLPSLDLPSRYCRSEPRRSATYQSLACRPRLPFRPVPSREPPGQSSTYRARRAPRSLAIAAFSNRFVAILGPSDPAEHAARPSTFPAASAIPLSHTQSDRN